MSGDLVPVVIPRPLLEQAFREARRAFPAECCGWLAGGDDGAAATLRACRNQQPAGDHPTASHRGAETAYVIGGADLIALSRSFDGPAPAVVIYHSHPNGRAYLSDTDRAVARSPWGDGPTWPVQQLVVGLDRHRIVEAALFGWSPPAGDFVELHRYPGAAL